jgi:hypothetical protein
VGSTIPVDTTIYIDTLYGTTPPEIDDLLRNRPKAHLSVVVTELSYRFGSSFRSVPGTEETLKELAGTMADIAPPPHRISIRESRRPASSTIQNLVPPCSLPPSP